MNISPFQRRTVAIFARTSSLQNNSTEPTEDCAADCIPFQASVGAYADNDDLAATSAAVLGCDLGSSGSGALSLCRLARLARFGGSMKRRKASKNIKSLVLLRREGLGSRGSLGAGDSGLVSIFVS